MKQKTMRYTPDEPIRDWTTGKEPKRVADQLLIGAMTPALSKIKGPIRMTSLTGADCVFEQNLAKALPTHRIEVAAIERHEPTYEALLTIAASLAHKYPNLRVFPKFGCRTFGQAMFNEFRTWANDGDERQNQVINADWDGAYSWYKLELLQKAMQRGALAPGGFLINTMSLLHYTRVTNKQHEDLMVYTEEGRKLSGPVIDMRRNRRELSEFGEAKVYGFVSATCQAAMTAGVSLKHLQTVLYDSFPGNATNSQPQIYHHFKRA